MLVRTHQDVLTSFPACHSTIRIGARGTRYPILSPSSTTVLSPATLSGTTPSTALRSLSNPLQVVASAAATVPSLAATATTTSSTLSTMKLFFAFVAGGLFFSSVMAIVAACYAVGMDNVQRLARTAKFLVESIWTTFVKGLLITRDTLLLGETIAADDKNDTDTQSSNRRNKRWKWRDAWQVFKVKVWQETKEKAVESVGAIRSEAKMYAAAVGAPGLIPLQYAVDRLMPYSIAAALEESLQDALVEAKDSLPKQIRKLTLKSFTAGPRAPKLESARVYDLGPDAMAFDCDVRWDSEVEASIQVNAAPAGFGFAKIPVTIKKVKFDGTVRVILTPLTKEAPGFGAAVVSFPSMPNVGLDVRVAGGEVTRVVPRLRSELLASIRRSIADSMLWPKRIVVPSTEGNNRNILSSTELKKLAATDPMLQAEEALASSQPMLRSKLGYQNVTELAETEHIRRKTVSDEDEDLLNSVVKLSRIPNNKGHHTAPKSSIAKIQNGYLWGQLMNARSHANTPS